MSIKIQRPPYFRWELVLTVGFVAMFATLVVFLPWGCWVVAFIPMIALYLWFLSDIANSRVWRYAKFVENQGILDVGETWYSSDSSAFGFSDSKQQFVSFDENGNAVLYQVNELTEAAFVIDDIAARDPAFWERFGERQVEDTNLVIRKSVTRQPMTATFQMSGDNPQTVTLETTLRGSLIRWYEELSRICESLQIQVNIKPL